MFDDHYHEWNNNRLKVIYKYFNKDFFKDKKLLEVGCGHAFFGKNFLELGSIVTCSDARKEYLSTLKDMCTIVHDLDNPWDIGFYDIIIHFGVLYHLSNPKKALSDAIKNCNILILETEVLDSLEDKIIFRKEEGFDQAFNNIGNQMSVGSIEKIILEHNKTFIRVEDKDLNSSFHHYDWTISNNDEWVTGRRKFWIIK